MRSAVSSGLASVHAALGPKAWPARSLVTHGGENSRRCRPARAIQNAVAGCVGTMPPMKRWILVVVALGGVIVLALAIFLFAGLGAAIKSVVERIGSAVTQTDVTLREADVSLASGEGTLRGLTIGNPKGFAAKYAFDLGEVRLRIDPSSVASDVILIREIAILGPRVMYELDGRARSNVGIIGDNVEAYGGGSRKPAGAGKDEPAPKDEKRFIVDDLLIRGGRLDLNADALVGKSAGQDLPEIHLRDLGKGKGGVTGAELAQVILEELADQAVEAAKSAGLERLQEKGLDILKKKMGGK